MSRRQQLTIVVWGSVIVGVIALVFGFSWPSANTDRTASADNGTTSATSTRLLASRGLSPAPRGARVGCEQRSEARFPGAYSDPDNVVVGPLVLVGAKYAEPPPDGEFRAAKFQALLAAGHTAIVNLPRPERRNGTRLAWGFTDDPAADRTVNFIACRRGKESGSRAEGRKVTFWSGGIASREPRCLPLEVYVDGATQPELVTVGLGVECETE